MKRLTRFFERLNYLDEQIIRVQTDLCYLNKDTLPYFKKKDYLDKIETQRKELSL